MPKNGWLTPKAISNRIKAKGLQKLRWYCQMCQKQCRDENGFKCHMMSESHQRQLLLVAENPGKYIHAFSEEFLRDFMQLLRLQYGSRRVHCNEVYQQYIKDKNHFHMNATRWVTLTGFVQWLGRTGLCEVDPTPKGWYIKYIDRSPEVLARQAAAAKKGKMDKDDEERTQKMIEQQIARDLASKEGEEEAEPVYTELQREEGETLSFALFKDSSSTDSASGSQDTEEGEEQSQPSSSVEEPPSVNDELPGAVGSDSRFSRKKPLPVAGPLALPNALTLKPGGSKVKDGENGRKRKFPDEGKDRATETKKKKLSALEELRLMEEQRKERQNRRDDWLHEGIVVKVMHKNLGEKYHRKKGVVEQVRDRYTAIVRMLDSRDKIKIDQANLETVIPAIDVYNHWPRPQANLCMQVLAWGRDKPVLVVNGAYRGLRAVLKSVDMDNFCVSIKIDQGPARDRIVEKVAYEDISKLA